MASLVVGQSINVRGPKGAMVYTPNMVRHFGMIAGGTGITPMLQIIRAVIRGRASGDKTQIDLIFANVNPEDILLREDLDQLAKDDKGFRVYYVLNNPPEKWEGGMGFVTQEMITVRISLQTKTTTRRERIADYFLSQYRNTFPHPQRTSSSCSADLHP